jgi:ubiquinone/menaquinone biosynthesis C-methylase UbiE
MTENADPFVAYYAEASASAATIERFQAVFELIDRVRDEAKLPKGSLDIADIGCGAGTQCFIWAKAGHKVHALDINEALVELGRKRAVEQRLEIDFQVGTATRLPWADASVDARVARTCRRLARLLA